MRAGRMIGGTLSSSVDLAVPLMALDTSLLSLSTESYVELSIHILFLPLALTVLVHRALLLGCDRKTAFAKLRDVSLWYCYG